jgi:hypothetical protein
LLGDLKEKRKLRPAGFKLVSFITLASKLVSLLTERAQMACG